MGVGKGSSSSKRFWILSSKKTRKGQTDIEKTLNTKAICDFRAAAFADIQSKLAGKNSCTVTLTQVKLIIAIGMDEDEHAAYNAARDIPEDENDGFVTEDEMDFNDVLDGTTRMDFSHAGGEFQHILEEELKQKAS